MKDTQGNPITEEEFMKDIGHGVVTQDWKTTVLMALNGSGVNESEALMQIRVIEPMMQEYLKEQRNAVLEELKAIIKQQYTHGCSPTDIVEMVSLYINKHE